MWLLSIFAVLCLLRNVELADKVQSKVDNALLRNHSSMNDNNIDDDNDDYLPPYLDWSDTFDWQLLKAFDSPDQKNVLISPLSVKILLAMLYEGSAGLTERQFQNVLQFAINKTEVRHKYSQILAALKQGDKDSNINIGTRLFLDSSIQAKQTYVAKVKTGYDTDIIPTNFVNKQEASQIINNWVTATTNGKIKEIVTAEEIQDILLIATNAIYFKGLWRHQFPKEHTHSSGFYITPSHIVTVPYMMNTDSYFYGESKELDAKILRLPYKGKHFAFFIVLPNAKAGLEELIKNINLQILKRQLYLLDNVTVEVVVPKFRFDFTARYTKILQDMGLMDMFQNTASFSGIAQGVGVGAKRLLVNDIKQKAGIEFNEEGSVLYAATDVQLGNKFGDANFTFNATHPFLFFIEDQTTHSILFVGKLVNPLDTEAQPLPSRFGETGTTQSPIGT